MLLEQKLSELHQKDFVALTGNATVALAKALSVLGLNGVRVAIPNNVCINVPIAILLSGNEPFYLDISEETLGLEPNCLQTNIEKIDAVVAVHNYGSVCEIDKIAEICNMYSIPLIEDFAVAQGATFEGRAIGSFGDISIVSFGAGKIIDAGHGGAMLTDDVSLYQNFFKEIAELEKFNHKKEQAIAQLNQTHTNIYNQYYGNKEIDKARFILKNVIEKTMTGFLYQYNSSYTDKISYMLSLLKENIEKRKEQVLSFENMFQAAELNNKLKIFKPKYSGSVPWRFNLFFETGRDDLLKYLLKRKYKVSSWHPQTDVFFMSKDDNKVHTPISNHIGETILNLWVNNEVDDRYSKAISAEILNFMEAY